MCCGITSTRILSAKTARTDCMLLSKGHISKESPDVMCDNSPNITFINNSILLEIHRLFCILDFRVVQTNIFRALFKQAQTVQ